MVPNWRSGPDDTHGGNVSQRTSAVHNPFNSAALVVKSSPYPDEVHS
jgi:hypothetical protein